MKSAHFAFATTLRPLLVRDLRNGLFELPFTGPQSVKHLIESLGIPHTEIGGVCANGKPVGLDYLVQDGDSLQVQAEAPRRYDKTEPRFVLDAHLGKLSAHLRMLGLDCLYRSDYEDAELVQVSLEQARILLTRDRRLLMHKVIAQGCLVRSLNPFEQLHEIISRFRLTQWVKPFQRCLRCNHPLEPVSKAAILDRLEPLTKKYFNEFHLCPACNQVYWKGSHYERMLQLISRVSQRDQ